MEMQKNPIAKRTLIMACALMLGIVAAMAVKGLIASIA